MRHGTVAPVQVWGTHRSGTSSGPLHASGAHPAGLTPGESPHSEWLRYPTNHWFLLSGRWKTRRQRREASPFVLAAYWMCASFLRIRPPWISSFCTGLPTILFINGRIGKSYHSMSAGHVHVGAETDAMKCHAMLQTWLAFFFTIR